MKHSDSMAAIGAALVKAQAEIKPIGKDAQNPHFRNRYATLDALTDFVRPILQKHGLTVIQGGTDAALSRIEGGVEYRVAAIEVETMLLHTSGEWISSSYVMPIEKSTPQGAGSAITYGRRYGLSSLLALTTDEDEDGNLASERSGPESKAADIKSRPAPREGAASEQTGGQTLPAAGEKFDAKCPKCSGPMYDNRIGKRNPAAPDAKCRDKSCDGVIWPPRENKAKAVVAASPIDHDNLQESLDRQAEEEMADLPF